MNKQKIVSMLLSTTILLSLYSNAPIANVNAESLNDLEQQQQELEEQSNQLNGTISHTEQELNSLNSERQYLIKNIVELQQNVDYIAGQIDEQEQEIILLEEQINQLNEEIEILQENIANRDEILAEQARGVQITGSTESLVDLILSAESLTDLVGKMEVVNALVKNNNSIMEDQINDKETVELNKIEVHLAKEETSQMKADLEMNRNFLVSEKAELDTQVQFVTEEYNLTNEERNALVSEQRAIASKTSEISNEIQSEKNRIEAEAAEARRIAAEAEARRVAAAEAEAKKVAVAEEKKETTNSSPVQASTSNKTPAAPKPEPKPAPKPKPEPEPKPDPKPTQPSTPSSSGWSRPASGRISSEYGYRIHPITGTRRLHTGIDIAGSGGITAARSGTVSLVRYDASGYGHYAIINHGNGLSTLYAHMSSRPNVSVGQSVSGGQRIGTMGTTGSSTGVHLHFEVRQNGRPVNPRNYVNF